MDEISENAEGALELAALKARGREALERARAAKAEAARLREAGDQHATRAKELVRRSFKIESDAAELEARGEVAGARAQRELVSRMREAGEKAFALADRLGEKAAELERERYRQKRLAEELADRIRAMTEGRRPPG